MNKPPLIIYLASPRGFCAGVDRAIQIVETALEKYGAPVYVRHEIVHNKYVVDSLKAKGAIFVEELDEIPNDGQPVVFSAHGVPKNVPEEAKAREMFYLDATCPLVSKVHYEAERYFKQGRQIVLIGHAGHPEVVGTMGQLPDGVVLLVETVADVARLRCAEDQMIGGSDDQNLHSSAHPLIRSSNDLAYCTQTTLSVDDTIGIVEALKAKFPNIHGPKREDICYATTNRQAAVKAIAPKSEALFVIGSPNSSNSNRLVEVAMLNGCKNARLVERASAIDWSWLNGVSALGLTAGASAPEILVDEVIAEARKYFNVTIEEVAITKENVFFKIPTVLTEAA
jgi:4-hydroxy-3-methylbut-2-en-1-yl diphosphate reductase